MSFRAESISFFVFIDAISMVSFLSIIIYFGAFCIFSKNFSNTLFLSPAYFSTISFLFWSQFKMHFFASILSFVVAWETILKIADAAIFALVTVVGLAKSDGVAGRITSYNVCYTKLLRLKSVQDLCDLLF